MQWQTSLVLAVVAALLVVRAAPAPAAEGRREISQAGVLASGGFPYVISAPGSYVLTSDLTPPSGVMGIRVDADDVNIDLNGFGIRGNLVCVPGSCTGTGPSVAIGVPAAPLTTGRRCSVRNGSIVGVTQAIDLRDEAFVDAVSVSSTSFHGIVLGPNSLVTRTRVTSVGRSALFLGQGSGYAQNVFARTGQFFAFGSVFGGEPVGENACDDDRCGGARRRFYLTPSDFDGAAADTACDAGFHMASRFELQDPSALRYDFARGFIWSGVHDQGQGPPHTSFGWIRTGGQASTLETVGLGNCNSWQSASAGHYGNVLQLRHEHPTNDPGPAIEHGWRFFLQSCSFALPVWCVEDD